MPGSETSITAAGSFKQKEIEVLLPGMKKMLSIGALLLAVAVLTGCSAASNPSSTASTTSSIWKSADGGKTWTVKVKTNNKIDISAVDVLSVAINPYDPKNVLVGTAKNGILVTTDGGDNWSSLKFQSEKVYGLAIDHIDGRIVYASGVWQGRGKIFKSLDSGQTWQEIYTTPASGPLVISLVLDEKNSGVVYATTSDDQVMKSVDGGQSWKNIYQAQSPVLSMAIDSGNDNLIYMVLQGGGILRSHDGGNTFEDISRSVFSVATTSQGTSVVTADPNNSNTVYVAGQIGILRSKDGGNTWGRLKLLSDSQSFPVKALAINPSNSNELIYGAAQATYKSSDGGISWTTSQFETSKTINILKYSPGESGVIYMGLSGITK